MQNSKKTSKTVFFGPKNDPFWPFFEQIKYIISLLIDVKKNNNKRKTKSY